MKPLVVGLIGGIGSGKSRVAQELAGHGGIVLSGDQFGHEALRQPDIRAKVLDRWGREVLDEQGEISRRTLGRIVFANPDERRALEGLVFPWIERRIQEEVRAAKNDRSIRLVVLDAAVMLEAGWDRMCDYLIFVHAPREVRLQRLAEQRGWTEKEVQARESAQLSLTEKESRADAAVDNSGTPEQLAAHVQRLLKQWNAGC